jgi:UDP-glucose 4-epimerase
MLASSGRHVTIIDRQPVSSLPLPKSISYLVGDCSDGGFLLKSLQGMDEVIDLAYTTVPKTSYDDPVSDILENLPLAVRLFDVAHKLSVSKIVIVSSGGTVYGKTETIPISESHSTNPTSPYGITKLAIEKYAMMYHHLKKLPVICVRPSNAFGEGQKPFIGQGFIATAIASILKQEEIVLFGEAGTIRDYIYVSDLARGIIAALDKGTPGSCYNIGTGVGRNNREVLDVISFFAAEIGIKLKVRVVGTRGFDVPSNVLDCTKMKQEMGWEPLVPFEEGIRKTWDWFCSQFHGNH